MKKTLVAYFSASGVTERAAKAVAEAGGFDLYSIEPAVPYTKADLDWKDKKSRSSIEMQDESSRPAISGKAVDMNAYGTIFLGFPIWWYVAPTIVNTFLEAHDFAGKTIVLFATSGGSGFGKTVEKLKGSVAADTKLIEGKLLNRFSKEELTAWIKELGL